MTTIRRCTWVSGWVALVATACGLGGCAPDEDPPVVAPPTSEPAAPSRIARHPELPVFDEDRAPRAVAPGSEDLVALPGGQLLAASDATTDAVYLVDVPGRALAHRVRFEPGSWPGRMAAGDGGVYVVLRGAGELVHVTAQGMIDGRVEVCPAPRGVSYDAGRARVWVACASGELVSVRAPSMQIAWTRLLDTDLRDVVAMQEGVYVSRFRSAELLHVDPELRAVIQRGSMPAVDGAWGLQLGANDRVNTLWRLRRGEPVDGAGPFLLATYHTTSRLALRVGPSPDERADAASEEVVTGGYGGEECAGAVASTLGRILLSDDGVIENVEAHCISGRALPIDVVNDAYGAPLVMHAAPVLTQQLPEGVEASPVEERAPIDFDGPAPVGRFDLRLATAVLDYSQIAVLNRGEGLYLSISVDFERRDIIPLVTDSPMHLGQVLFHGDPGTGIACASCHPEGGDDGQPWRFARVDGRGAMAITVRRTQNLRAGVEGKLHWDGEFDDLGALMGDVFAVRMSGFSPREADVAAIRDWLGQLTPEPGATLRPEELAVVDRGAELFASAGCAGCHSGAMFTDYQFHDVGTGGLRKTPTLRGIAQRARLMSDGCATWLGQRFDQGCGGDAHGDLSGASEVDLDALVAYLRTL